MVKVPGFFASKKSGKATEKPSTAKTTPVKVFCKGKMMSEIIRLEKENLKAGEGESIKLDFQGLYQQKSRLSNEEENMEDVRLHQSGSAAKKVSAEPFEDVLGEIDKEINKYDFDVAVTTGFGGNT